MYTLKLLQYLFEFETSYMLDICKILTNYSLNCLIVQSVLENILLSVKFFKKHHTYCSLFVECLYRRCKQSIFSQSLNNSTSTHHFTTPTQNRIFQKSNYSKSWNIFNLLCKNCFTKIRKERIVHLPVKYSSCSLICI